MEIAETGVPVSENRAARVLTATRSHQRESSSRTASPIRPGRCSIGIETRFGPGSQVEAVTPSPTTRPPAPRNLEFLERRRPPPDDKGAEVPFRPNRARVSDVFDALSAVCALDAQIEPPAWLSEDASEQPPASEFLAVANGLLHLPSGEMHSPTPAYFAVHASAVAFDAKAPPPRQWLAFLDSLFGDDVEGMTTLQDWFGYALSSDTAQQKILLIVGPKRSGEERLRVC